MSDGRESSEVEGEDVDGDDAEGAVNCIGFSSPGEWPEGTFNSNAEGDGAESGSEQLYRPQAAASSSAPEAALAHQPKRTSLLDNPTSTDGSDDDVSEPRGVTGNGEGQSDEFANKADVNVTSVDVVADAYGGKAEGQPDEHANKADVNVASVGVIVDACGVKADSALNSSEPSIESAIAKDDAYAVVDANAVSDMETGSRNSKELDVVPVQTAVDVSVETASETDVILVEDSSVSDSRGSGVALRCSGINGDETSGIVSHEATPTSDLWKNASATGALSGVAVVSDAVIDISRPTHSDSSCSSTLTRAVPEVKDVASAGFDADPRPTHSDSSCSSTLARAMPEVKAVESASFDVDPLSGLLPNPSAKDTPADPKVASGLTAGASSDEVVHTTIALEASAGAKSATADSDVSAAEVAFPTVVKNNEPSDVAIHPSSAQIASNGATDEVADPRLTGAEDNAITKTVSQASGVHDKAMNASSSDSDSNDSADARVLPDTVAGASAVANLGARTVSGTSSKAKFRSTVPVPANDGAAVRSGCEKVGAAIVSDSDSDNSACASIVADAKLQDDMRDGLTESHFGHNTRRCFGSSRHYKGRRRGDRRERLRRMKDNLRRGRVSNMSEYTVSVLPSPEANAADNNIAVAVASGAGEHQVEPASSILEYPDSECAKAIRMSPASHAKDKSMLSPRPGASSIEDVACKANAAKIEPGFTQASEDKSIRPSNSADMVCKANGAKGEPVVTQDSVTFGAHESDSVAPCAAEDRQDQPNVTENPAISHSQCSGAAAAGKAESDDATTNFVFGPASSEPPRASSAEPCRCEVHDDTGTTQSAVSPVVQRTNDPAHGVSPSHGTDIYATKVAEDVPAVKRSSSDALETDGVGIGQVACTEKSSSVVHGSTSSALQCPNSAELRKESLHQDESLTKDPEPSGQRPNTLESSQQTHAPPDQVTSAAVDTEDAPDIGEDKRENSATEGEINPQSPTSPSVGELSPTSPSDEELDGDVTPIHAGPPDELGIDAVTAELQSSLAKRLADAAFLGDHILGDPIAADGNQPPHKKRAMAQSAETSKVPNGLYHPSDSVGAPAEVNLRVFSPSPGPQSPMSKRARLAPPVHAVEPELSGAGSTAQACASTAMPLAPSETGVAEVCQAAERMPIAAILAGAARMLERRQPGDPVITVPGNNSPGNPVVVNIAVNVVMPSPTVARQPEDISDHIRCLEELRTLWKHHIADPEVFTRSEFETAKKAIFRAFLPTDAHDTTSVSSRGAFGLSRPVPRVPTAFPTAHDVQPPAQDRGRGGSQKADMRYGEGEDRPQSRQVGSARTRGCQSGRGRGRGRAPVGPGVP